jgi:hypothetical protein
MTREQIEQQAVERFPTEPFRAFSDDYSRKMYCQRKDEQQAYIEGALMMMESQWVSVDERLPEKGVYVWCYSKSLGMVSDCYDCDVSDEHWFKGDREEYLTDVTHWMPLPEPPKPTK